MDAFLVYRPLKALNNTRQHSPIWSDMMLFIQSTLMFLTPCGNLGFNIFQGLQHAARDRTADPVISGQSAVHPEPQLPEEEEEETTTITATDSFM